MHVLCFQGRLEQKVTFGPLLDAAKKGDSLSFRRLLLDLPDRWVGAWDQVLIFCRRNWSFHQRLQSGYTLLCYFGDVEYDQHELPVPSYSLVCLRHALNDSRVLETINIADRDVRFWCCFLFRSYACAPLGAQDTSYVVLRDGQCGSGVAAIGHGRSRFE